MKQLFYIDGKRQKTITGELAKLRRYLDNTERDWLKGGLFPLTPIGAFDPNNAHTVTRVSPDELVIVTTGNKTLRFVNLDSAR